MDYYMSNIKLSMQYRNLASQPGPPPSFLSLAVHSDDQRKAMEMRLPETHKVQLGLKKLFPFKAK